MANSKRIAGLVGPILMAMLASEFPLVQPHLYDRQIPPVVYLSGVLMFSQYDRCLSDAVRFVREQALPWFARFSTPEALLQSDSPLPPDTRERLRIGLTGGDPDLIAASRKLLGIRS